MQICVRLLRLKNSYENKLFVSFKLKNTGKWPESAASELAEQTLEAVGFWHKLHSENKRKGERWL